VTDEWEETPFERGLEKYCRALEQKLEAAEQRIAKMEEDRYTMIRRHAQLEVDYATLTGEKMAAELRIAELERNLEEALRESEFQEALRKY